MTVELIAPIEPPVQARTIYHQDYSWLLPASIAAAHAIPSVRTMLRPLTTKATTGPTLRDAVALFLGELFRQCGAFGHEDSVALQRHYAAVTADVQSEYQASPKDARGQYSIDDLLFAAISPTNIRGTDPRRRFACLVRYPHVRIAVLLPFMAGTRLERGQELHERCKETLWRTGDGSELLLTALDSVFGREAGVTATLASLGVEVIVDPAAGRPRWAAWMIDGAP